VADISALWPVIAFGSADVALTIFVVLRRLNRYAAHDVEDTLILDQPLTKTELAGLASKNVWKRRETADALGRSDDPSAVQHLILALRDPDDDVRAIAARGLGTLEAASALDYLVSLFSDISEASCPTVADAVIHFGNEAHAALFTALGTGRRLADKPAYWVLRCIENIGDPTGALHVRSTTCGTIGPLLTHDSPRVRAAAAAAIGRVGVPEDFVCLRPSLLDPSPEVRRQAASAVGRIGGKDAVAMLLEAFDDPDWDVSFVASRALVQLGEKAVDSAQRLASSATGIAYARCLEVLDIAGRAVVL